MKKFIGIVLVLCSLALPLAGCKEAISTVTCNTISELEDIPGQILSTPESAETEPEYNFIHFRYDNIWTVSALVNYEIVDNGQNIKFEINDSRYRDKVFYTSMSNVELVYRDNNVDYATNIPMTNTSPYRFSSVRAIFCLQRNFWVVRQLTSYANGLEL